MTFIDSSIDNTRVGILTSRNQDPSNFSNGSLALENIIFKNVDIAIQGPQNTTLLVGTPDSMELAAWGQGHLYNPGGPYDFQGVMSAFPRMESLEIHSRYYERSKPSYADIPDSKFMSVRGNGAKGDGVADDTAVLQKTLDTAASTGQIVFVDAGTYRISMTLCIPGGSKIVGESYSVVMSSGSFFANMSAPKAVVRVGEVGEIGRVEWSDMIVAAQGPQPGAILIKWNLASPEEPSGLWDVHTRIGGFKGSELQFANCPPTPDLSSSKSIDSASALGHTTSLSNNTSPNSMSSEVSINRSCIGAFMSMHITKSASGLYMQNNWLWNADHDLDLQAVFSNITVYSGRGVYIESKEGRIWLVASAVEHHSLYQYQLANTHNIFMGQIQTETAYYQPHPDIKVPFMADKSLNDPTDADICQENGTNCDGLGLRILDSQNINIYGAGLYSFFNDYNSCECF